MTSMIETLNIKFKDGGPSGKEASERRNSNWGKNKDTLHLLTFEFVGKMQSVTIRIKATKQYFPRGAVCYAVQGDSNF